MGQDCTLLCGTVPRLCHGMTVNNTELHNSGGNCKGNKNAKSNEGPVCRVWHVHDQVSFARQTCQKKAFFFTLHANENISFYPWEYESPGEVYTEV